MVTTRDIGDNPLKWLDRGLQKAMNGSPDWSRIGYELSAEVAVRYRARWGPDRVLHDFRFGKFSYLFDTTPDDYSTPEGRDQPANRALAAWGNSDPDLRFGDRRNLRHFPVPPIIRSLDRGHLIAMSMGGGDFVNLVPQEPGLNRGWNAEGKRWRALERAATSDPGAFVFVAVSYVDISDIPSCLA